jgi:hypothetical protein
VKTLEPKITQERIEQLFAKVTDLSKRDHHQSGSNPSDECPTCLIAAAIADSEFIRGFIVHSVADTVADGDISTFLTFITMCIRVGMLQREEELLGCHVAPSTRPN